MLRPPTSTVLILPAFTSSQYFRVSNANDLFGLGVGNEQWLAIGVVHLGGSVLLRTPT